MGLWGSLVSFPLRDMARRRRGSLAKKRATRASFFPTEKPKKICGFSGPRKPAVFAEPGKKLKQPSAVFALQ